MASMSVHQVLCSKKCLKYQLTKTPVGRRARAHRPLLFA